MQALRIVINEMNFYNELFKEPLIEFPLSVQQIKKIAEKIDSDLSPENLTCDGEASAKHIGLRVELLTTAQGELAMIFGEME